MMVRIFSAGNCLRATTAMAGVMMALPASAQDVSESRAWQFETPQEQAARSAVLDLIMKRRAGIYAAPVYNTTIAHQYNCSVSATAAGNGETQSATANSPSVSGPSSTATGNADATENAGEGGSSSIGIDQRNAGAVGATVSGSASAGVTGDAHQALNSSQNNSGDQSASVRGSSACGFGAVN